MRIDAVAFRLVPDTKSMDLLVTYADRGAVLYRDQMRGCLSGGAREMRFPPAPQRSAPPTIDNDSWVDVAFSGPSGVAFAMNRQGTFDGCPDPGARRPRSRVRRSREPRAFVDLIAASAVYRNQAQGKTAAGKAPAGIVDAVAFAQADFDADGRTDLAAVAADGSIHLLTNQTATKNQWLRVKLTGVKNLKTAVRAARWK